MVSGVAATAREDGDMGGEIALRLADIPRIAYLEGKGVAGRGKRGKGEERKGVRVEKGKGRGRRTVEGNGI